MLTSLVREHDLDFSEILESLKIDDIATPAFNELIYAVFERMTAKFLDSVVKSRRHRFSSLEFTTYTNFLDSHVAFVDADLNRWFEVWRFE